MGRNLQIGVVFTGLLLVAGCSGRSTLDTSNLPAPVNTVMPNTSGDMSQVIAADAMAGIGKVAVPALVEALSDNDPVVRMQACRALASIGAPASAAVDALKVSLGDKEEAVRLQAAKALGHIGEASLPAVPQLLQMLRGK